MTGWSRGEEVACLQLYAAGIDQQSPHNPTRDTDIGPKQTLDNLSLILVTQRSTDVFREPQQLINGLMHLILDHMLVT